MTDLKIEFIGEMQVVQLRPGDTIVISTEQSFGQDVADRLVGRLREQFPGHDILVLANGLKFGVVRDEA